VGTQGRSFQAWMHSGPFPLLTKRALHHEMESKKRPIERRSQVLELSFFTKWEARSETNRRSQVLKTFFLLVYHEKCRECKDIGNHTPSFAPSFWYCSSFASKRVKKRKKKRRVFILDEHTAEDRAFRCRDNLGKKETFYTALSRIP
jgi:hypothetical protein